MINFTKLLRLWGFIETKYTQHCETTQYIHNNWVEKIFLCKLILAFKPWSRLITQHFFFFTSVAILFQIFMCSFKIRIYYCFAFIVLIIMAAFLCWLVRRIFRRMLSFITTLALVRVFLCCLLLDLSFDCLLSVSGGE